MESLCVVPQMFLLTKHSFGMVGGKHPTGYVLGKKIQGLEVGGKGISSGFHFFFPFLPVYIRAEMNHEYGLFNFSLSI